MIKEVTIYETTDGCRFNTEKEAKKYESLYEMCKKIMSQLRPHEDNGAVQQDVELVKKAFNEFMDLCAEAIPYYKKTFICVKGGNTHPSWAQRVISDYNIKCLRHISFRFSCTNMVSGIEYEQPYFVEHESEWEKVIY
jgi:hypothetical protein